MASGTIKRYITKAEADNKSFDSISYIASRATGVSGGINIMGAKAFLNIKFRANATASNSPQIGSLGAGTFPRLEVAASCIDITSGISSSITSAVPAGISTEGKIYVKEITTDHIYALTCAYIADI